MERSAHIVANLFAQVVCTHLQICLLNANLFALENFFQIMVHRKGHAAPRWCTRCKDFLRWRLANVWLTCKLKDEEGGKDAVFLTRGDRFYCFRCVEQIRKCPVCRKHWELCKLPFKCLGVQQVDWNLEVSWCSTSGLEFQHQ